jgi:hypothetical protein
MRKSFAKDRSVLTEDYKYFITTDKQRTEQPKRKLAKCQPTGWLKAFHYLLCYSRRINRGARAKFHARRTIRRMDDDGVWHS